MSPDPKSSMALNPLEKISVRWVLTVLVAAIAATGLGFVIGMWLGG